MIQDGTERLIRVFWRGGGSQDGAVGTHESLGKCTHNVSFFPHSHLGVGVVPSVSWEAEWDKAEYEYRAEGRIEEVSGGRRQYYEAEIETTAEGEGGASKYACYTICPEHVRARPCLVRPAG